MNFLPEQNQIFDALRNIRYDLNELRVLVNRIEEAIA
jgi:hypothetical protein